MNLTKIFKIRTIMKLRYILSLIFAMNVFINNAMERQPHGQINFDEHFYAIIAIKKLAYKLATNIDPNLKEYLTELPQNTHTDSGLLYEHIYQIKSNQPIRVPHDVYLENVKRLTINRLITPWGSLQINNLYDENRDAFLSALGASLFQQNKSQYGFETKIYRISKMDSIILPQTERILDPWDWKKGEYETYHLIWNELKNKYLAAKEERKET